MTMTHPPNDKRRFTLWISGFFLVVFAVNGVFMYFALRSHPGVETENAYEKGLDYNFYLTEAEAAKTLGWTYSLETREETGKTEIFFQVLNADGLALKGLKVRGKAFWPVQEGHDRLFDLSEETPGLYTGEVPLDFMGQWDLRFIIFEGNKPKAQFAKRVVLK